MKYLVNTEEEKAVAATARPMEQRAHVRFILKADGCSVLENILDIYISDIKGPQGYIKGDVITLLLRGDIQFNEGKLNAILENNPKVHRGTLFTRFIEVTDELDIAREKTVLKPRLIAHTPKLEEVING